MNVHLAVRNGFMMKIHLAVRNRKGEGCASPNSRTNPAAPIRVCVAPLMMLVAALSLSSTGCVTKQTHATLQKELDASRSRLEAAATGSEQAIEREKLKVATLELQLASSEEQLAAFEEQLAALNQKLRDAQTSSRAAFVEIQEELAQVVKDRSSLKASVNDMKEALADARKRKLQADPRIQGYRELLSKFRPLIDAGLLQVKIVDGRMVVALSMDILFDSGSARLSPGGIETIRELTAILAGIPGKRYQVEGHTDTVPIYTKSYPSNWELGSARALSITKTMIVEGMPPERVSGASFGEWHPASDNETEDGRAKNRRIEIVVVPDLSQLPGSEELSRVAK